MISPILSKCRQGLRSVRDGALLSEDVSTILNLTTFFNMKT